MAGRGANADFRPNIELPTAKLLPLIIRKVDDYQ
jgi:hypothetical protein